MNSARILSWPSASKIALLGKYLWLKCKGVKEKRFFSWLTRFSAWLPGLRHPPRSGTLWTCLFTWGGCVLIHKRSSVGCFVIWGIWELEGDNPQHWKLKAWIFAYCLYSPSEKLSVLDGVMCCVLFHQMRDADAKLCFPADKQDRVGVPAQKDSACAQLKSSWSGECTLKT